MAAFSNDEPWQVMALEAMTERPLGNPANYFDGTREPPAHWGTLRFPGGLYYGGAQLDLALLAFGPLHAAGLPTFPTAPIVLRALSALCALVGLLLFYNFCREHSGGLAAWLATLVMLTDEGFLYYATNIKPDSLQFLLGLIALAVALHHARSQNRASLVALGIVAGLVQGTKAGGAWLIPLALLAAWTGSGNSSARLAEFAKRMAWLGLAALAAYFGTTPYAFVDGYFWSRVQVGWHNLRAPLPSIGLSGWLMELYVQWGLVLCALGGAGLIRALAGGWRRDESRPFSFAALLVLSQLLWYGLVVSLWASLGYLIVALALLAFLAADGLSRFLRWLRLEGRAGRGAAAACAVVAVVVVFADRWDVLPVRILQLQTQERSSTVVEVNR